MKKVDFFLVCFILFQLNFFLTNAQTRHKTIGTITVSENGSATFKPMSSSDVQKIENVETKVQPVKSVLQSSVIVEANVASGQVPRSGKEVREITTMYTTTSKPIDGIELNLLYQNNCKQVFTGSSCEMFLIESSTLIRLYGEKDYFISPTTKDIKQYNSRIQKQSKNAEGKVNILFQFVDVSITDISREMLKSVNINVPSFINDKMKLFLPECDIVYLLENNIPCIMDEFYGMQYDQLTSEINTNAEPASPKSTIWSEGFEGTFPGSSYSVGDAFPTDSGEDYWDDVTCDYYSGSKSIWCADIGDQPDCVNYDDSMSSWVKKIAPINVSGYSNVLFNFHTKFNTEAGYDFMEFWASDDDVNWTLAALYDGNSNGWIAPSFILNGYSTFYWEFDFESDLSVHDYVGAYLDDMAMTGGDPVCPNLTLYSGSGSNNTYYYNTSTHVLDVSTSVQNNGTEPAGSFDIGFYLSHDPGTLEYFVDYRTVSGLTNEYYATKNISKDLDELSIPDGTYYVVVYYDDLNQVAECDEYDNGVYYTPTFNYPGQACTITLDPQDRAVGYQAGQTTFNLTTNLTNCTWNVASNQGWCTVSPTSGTGNQIITASYTQNTGQQRVANITAIVAGGAQDVSTVTQAPPPCTITLDPSNRDVGYQAGSTNFTLTTNLTSCTWTASSDASWCTVSPTSGTGNAPITANYSQNNGSSRIAHITVTVAGGAQDVSTVTQGPTGYTLSGIITYPNTSSTPLSSVNINLKNSGGTIIGTTTTNSSGSYSFSNLDNGNYTLEPTTSKSWGGVSAPDVLLFKKHIGALQLLQGIFLASGDVNGSGSLSAPDVLLIKKRIGAMISSFSVGDWLFNNYNPVTISGENVTQNFNGLCYGDANGSYNPPAKGYPFSNPFKNIEGALTIGILTNVPQGQISVPVHISQIVNMGSFQFSMQFDPTIMTFNGTSNWYPGISEVAVGEPTPGYLTFVWAADNAGISILDDIFFNLDFTWNGNNSTSLVSMSSHPTPIEFSDWEGRIFEPAYANGSLTGASVGIEKTEPQIIRIYPNPASDIINVTSDDNIKCVEMLSYLGQSVFTKSNLEMKQFQIDISNLPTGVYFVKIQTDRGIMSTKITVNRR